MHQDTSWHPGPVSTVPSRIAACTTAPAGLIENSRSAFEAAIARGFTIECDVQPSRDGIPVIFHDNDLERLTGRKGPVGSLTAAELTSTPLLDSAAGDCPQLLTAFPKADRRADAAAGGTEAPAERGDGRRAGAHRGRGDQRLSRADDGRELRSRADRRHPALRVYGPLGIITYGYDKKDWDGGLSERERMVLRHLLHWPWTRFSFISCYVNSLDLPAVRFFRALGVPVTAWTVRTPEERRLANGRAEQIVFEGFDPESA